MSQSHTGIVAGDEETDLSVVEPSKSGNLGYQSYNTNSSIRTKLTREEREAAYYNNARKWKEKEMHATSPNNTFHRDLMRKRGELSAWVSSSRALASHSNSFGNPSKNSRATSPSFSFPTLYEQTSYDAPHNAANPGYHPAQYIYQSAYPPTQGSNPSYLTPYTYDASPHSMPQRNPSESSLTAPEPFPWQKSPIPPGWVPQPYQDPINPIGPTPSPPPHSPYRPYSVNLSVPTRPPGQQQPRRMFVKSKIQMMHNTSSRGNSRVVSPSRDGDDVSSTAVSTTGSRLYVQIIFIIFLVFELFLPAYVLYVHHLFLTWYVFTTTSRLGSWTKSTAYIS
jgi:hypothetical protein